MATSILAAEILSSAQSIGKAATGYSNSVDFSRCQGDASVFIISTAGSITVTQQCSMDNVTFYDPVNSSGTALGGVATALTVTTGTWVSYTPVMAPYIRFKIVEGNSAATVVTLKLVFREEV